MYENEANGKPIEAGIILFKSLKAGFLSFIFKDGKQDNTTIDTTILTNYLEQRVLLLNEILEEQIPFEEKFKRKDCKDFAKFTQKTLNSFEKVQ